MTNANTQAYNIPHTQSRVVNQSARFASQYSQPKIYYGFTIKKELHCISGNG